jgi:hypothetical protein
MGASARGVEVRFRGWLLAAMGLLLLFAGMAGAEQARAAGVVTVDVIGKGDVTGDGISCSESVTSDCEQLYADETGEEECNDDIPPICFTPRFPPTKQFTAGADRNGYQFASWTGCDSVDARVCTLTVNDDKAITARFDDVTDPIVSNLQPNSGVKNGSIELSASASDNSGSINRVQFRVDTFGSGPGPLVGSDTSAPYSVSYNTASRPDGLVTFRATALDNSNRTGTATTSFTIDNTPPSLSVSSGPDGETFGPQSTQTWQFSASDFTSGVAAVECSVVPEGEAASFGACSGGATSHSVTDQPAGNYVFTVRARDNGGLVTTAASRSFSIDATAPETTITSGPADGSTTAQRSVSFGFASSEPGSSFECRLHAAGVTPPAFGDCSGPSSHAAANLTPGNSYTFSVRATDGAGNVDESAASRTFTVDADAPDVDPPAAIILEGPKPVVKTKKKRAKARFVFEADEPGSTFRCSLDGGAFAPCSSPLTIKVKKGKHSMRVRATDVAGNTEPGAAEWTWKVKKKKRKGKR